MDYSSVNSLYHVLKRQQVDTVISVIPDAEVQLNIIDACLMAGVRRFVPAEFETSPDQRPLYVPGDKMNVLARLDQVRAQLEVSLLLYFVEHPTSDRYLTSNLVHGFLLRPFHGDFCSWGLESF